MSSGKKYLFGVPNIIFAIIILGVIGALLFPIFAIMVLVPVTGYYVWQLRQKNKELEERLAAVEGRK